MCADRALEGSRLADIGVAAVPADPHLLFLTGKDLALLEVGGKSAVTCLVLLFDLAHHREESGQLGEALLLGLRGHPGVHLGPLVVLTACSHLKAGHSVGDGAAAEGLEPQLGVFLLVAGGLFEDSGQLLVAFLLCNACKLGVLVAGHALACKSFHQVLLVLGSLEFHNLFSSQIV